jgi:hypothetical protein
MAAGKKTGGRRRGVPNKTTANRRKEIANAGLAGLTPLDYMLSLLRDESNPTETRFEAAKAAAPYVHPKLANVQHSGDQENPLQHQVGVRWMTEAQAKARGWA